MAEITITAMRHVGLGGPSVPSKHRAWVDQSDWPGGGTVPVLKMQIGDCLITVWPADPEAIQSLGKELVEIGKTLAGDSDTAGNKE